MNDFIKHNGWFDRRFKFSLGDRYSTMRLALNLLTHLDTHHIVETGCMRTKGSILEGDSTLVFANYVDRYGGEVTTIDNNSDNMAICREATHKYREKIVYKEQDSLMALLHYPQRIDLLYLDSMDCPISFDAFESQNHQRMELQNSDHSLYERSIVLLDDNAFSNGGKTLLSKRWLEEHGWICLLDMYQSLWVKNPSTIF